MTVSTVAEAKEGLSADCQTLLAETNEFEIRSSGTDAAPTTADCLLGDLAAETMLDPLANEETTCWSKSDANEEFLQFSTDLFLFDKDSDIRPWPQVTLQCEIRKTVRVVPLSIAFADGKQNDVGIIADSVSLSMKAIMDNTDTALTSPVSLPLGTTAFFFVESDLSNQLELVLEACTYKGDAVTVTSDYVMTISNGITTGYSFASDVVGFTMQIYQNSKSNDIVQCDVAIGFASDIETPVSQEALAQDCPDTWSSFTIDGSEKCLKSIANADISTADSVCKSEGAKVPLPQSDAENDEYHNAFLVLGADEGDNVKVALGLNDVAIEGEWHDFAGNLVAYTNWFDGEPDNFLDTEDYVAMGINSKKWVDCGAAFCRNALIICEK